MKVEKLNSFSKKITDMLEHIGKNKKRCSETIKNVNV